MLQLAGISFLGAVVALIFLLPALIDAEYRAVLFRGGRPRRLSGASGVVAITYTSQFTGFGTATAPTAVQASQLMVQTAQVFFADGDSQAVIVHNWGLPASFPSFLFPEIMFYCAQQTASPSSFATAFTFGISNTNSVTMNKTGVGTGQGGTWNVIMRYPFSARG